MILSMRYTIKFHSGYLGFCTKSDGTHRIFQECTQEMLPIVFGFRTKSLKCPTDSWQKGFTVTDLRTLRTFDLIGMNTTYNGCFMWCGKNVSPIGTF